MSVAAYENVFCVENSVIDTKYKECKFDLFESCDLQKEY